MKLAVAQIKLTSRLDENRKKILSYIEKACSEGIEVVAFPETALTGYIYEDFLKVDYKEVEAALREIQEIVDRCDVCALIGTPLKEGDILYNSVVVLTPRGERYTYHKRMLTTYENDYFRAGGEETVFSYKGCDIGVIICRDQNNPHITEHLKKKGAKVIYICSAHYYGLVESKMKREKNIALPIARAYENNVYVLKANAVGTLMKKISFGNSMIVHPNGIVIHRGSEHDEELLSCEMTHDTENEQW